ncbi:MAG: tRNA (adenosine(37)-N6)-threonylcarbamoyltransferase complex transferase subunit TsaD [Verrucomicrobiales bacterium]|nr:tRNA (adenosine(37)-N6)-threonylcarbamoyltransferase complex transferase subunit TsaD [Verrucomicrobiales bacterium]
MLLLALETSCDETSAAVVSDGVVRANVVSSQVRLHAEYGGVVPELAAREHLRNLMTVVELALRQAHTEPTGFEAVAATRGPGLPGALLTGMRAAQALAFTLRRPFLGVHHHEAHLYSPWIEGEPPRARFDLFEPNVSLIVSGGHTLLVHVEAELSHRVLGATLDDAAGECFDKVGKMLGLPYPAGAHIERLAREGDARAWDFPRPMLDEPGDDFSFSGLKTAVRYHLRDHPTLVGDPQAVRDLCASVQAAIVEVLVTKTLRAAQRLGVPCVTASGGVTRNRALREALDQACAEAGLTLRLAPAALCTDNAAMIGVLAERKLLRGLVADDYDTEIAPDWALG